MDAIARMMYPQVLHSATIGMRWPYTWRLLRLYSEKNPAPHKVVEAERWCERRDSAADISVQHWLDGLCVYFRRLFAGNSVMRLYERCTSPKA